MNRILSRRLLIPAALGALIAAAAAAPAAASPRTADAASGEALTASYGEGDHCTVDIDTGVRVCAESPAELADAVYETTGERLVYSTSKSTYSADSAKLATSSSVYALGTIYSYPDYGGRSYTATSGYNCSQGLAFTYSDLGALGWNDDIDSFKSYNGCRTKLWEHPGFSGASYGYYTSDNDLGSWRNRASSIRWD